MNIRRLIGKYQFIDRIPFLISFGKGETHPKHYPDKG